MTGRGDERFVALLQSLRAAGASSAELGKVVAEAIENGWTLRGLAKAIGVRLNSVQYWLDAYQRSMTGKESKRGRPSLEDELPDHAAVLRRLASDPATAHLSARSIWELYLRHFECSPECQSNDCPHNTVSYHTAWRFLSSLPLAYREGRQRMKKRFKSSHPSLVPPGTIWVADRSKSDIWLLRDEATGEWARYEIGVFIDQGTMTILAIGAVEREVEGKFSPWFDAAAFNALLADALLGEITGVQGKPKALLIDWGKVENNQALEAVCKRLRIQIQRARPYDPASKPQVEAIFNFVHHQLEAYLPGYLGSLNRPDTRPPTTESGKLKKCIDFRTGEVYWGDDSGRRALSVREFNQLLKDWARQWNAKECGTWQGRRIELFQKGVQEAEFKFLSPQGGSETGEGDSRRRSHLHLSIPQGGSKTRMRDVKGGLKCAQESFTCGSSGKTVGWSWWC